MMIAGRIIFGFTGDAMSVAQSAMITIWFSGAELNFAFAIAVSTGRIASIINSYTAPWLYDSYGLEFFCLTSSLCCLVSLFNGVGAYILEIYATRSYNKVK
jgi:MFS family permease